MNNAAIVTTQCGYVAIVGRPNVGKSTLLNCLLQQKVSITSRKPQTTRHRILGIHTLGDSQLIYVDTPGIHQGSKKTMNKMMNKTAINTLHDVDAIAFVVDGTHWNDEDDYILQLLQKATLNQNSQDSANIPRIPCFLIVNKVDKIIDKQVLLPWIEDISRRYPFTAIIPLSAKSGQQVDVLEKTLRDVLPVGPHLFDDAQITDRSIRFMCAELLREKIFRFCGQELPYSATVNIESFKEDEKCVHIHALIVVDKENHKRMIIGNKGSKLKEMASEARVDMERLVDKKVFLQCWCKVKSGWADNEGLLKQLGYEH